MKNRFADTGKSYAGYFLRFVFCLVLTAAGTVLLKLTEDITWMGAFFTSVSARTAGFSTFSLGSFPAQDF